MSLMGEIEEHWTDLERQHKVIQEGALLALEEPNKVIDGEVRLAHRVRLPTERMLDVRLRTRPGLFPVEDDRLLEAAPRERFLRSKGGQGTVSTICEEKRG